MSKRLTTNAIYTAVVTEAKKEVSNLYCTSTYNATPPQLPCLFLREIGNYTPISAIDLAFTEEVNDVTFEAQIFANTPSTSKTQAYTILDAVSRAFKNMYFIKTFAEPLPNADEHIFRLAARFRRVVCGGDTMKTTED